MNLKSYRSSLLVLAFAFLSSWLTGCSANSVSSDRECYDYDVEEEKKYLNAIYPFYAAIAMGDFAAAFDMADPVTFSNVYRIQFLRESAGVKADFSLDVDMTDRIGAMNKDQFVAKMQGEQKYGSLSELDSIFCEWWEEDGDKPT